MRPVEPCPDLQEVKIDGSAGSVEDQSQAQTQDDVVPEHFVCSDTSDIEIMAHREIKHPQQESFIPDQSGVSKRLKTSSDSLFVILQFT